MIIPGEIITEIYPEVQIKEEFIDKILHGQPIYEKNLIKKSEFKKGGRISVFSKERFIGVFRVINNKIFAKSEFVLQPIK
jgi:tRNA U55 pseudouridine synthase TruB